MKHIVLNNNNITSYLGLDIVDKIINLNNLNYQNNKILFKTNDVLFEDLPDSYDLIIIRDLFIHLKNDEIFSKENYLNEIKWKRYAVHSTSTKQYDKNTDYILFYQKSNKCK